MNSTDKYEKRIRQLQKKRKKTRKALAEREKEVALIESLYGPEYFFRAVENRWLYGERE